MSKLFHNMAHSAQECYSSLEAMGQKVSRGYDNGTLWCDATWDSVLCWPSIAANTSYSMACPPLKGLDTEKTIVKHCHASGHWAGREEDDFSNPSGWTDFISCMVFDHEAVERAQEIARGLRKMEFVGLTLSFLSLIMSIAILTHFRRLRVFRNQIHLQLMLAILLTVIIRLIVYVDLIFTEKLGSLQASDVAYTINTTKVLCEAFYFLLEYGKTVAFAWMFIEGFYLHNTVVVTVFQEAPKLWKYLLIGWGLPLVHVTIWLIVVVVTRKEIERCLGLYYLHAEFWIMDSIRLTELIANTGFLLNIVRVLWYKVKETNAANESHQVKKSVKAALMLIPLLGIPNIMQTIPFTPTRHNITWFAIFTYIASFFYMFQGFMVAVVYCFTNREVINVIKSHYQRYRLQHSSADVLRRGSRSREHNNNAAYYRGSNSSNHPSRRPFTLQRNSSPVFRPSPPRDSYWTGGSNTKSPTKQLPPPPPYEIAVAHNGTTINDTGGGCGVAERSKLINHHSSSNSMTNACSAAPAPVEMRLLSNGGGAERFNYHYRSSPPPPPSIRYCNGENGSIYRSALDTFSTSAEEIPLFNGHVNGAISGSNYSDVGREMNNGPYFKS